MKQLKKLVSFVVAIALALSLTVNAFAADTHTITISSSKGHTYAAYQVFKGNEHNGVLSNVQWGDDVDGEALLTKLTENSSFAACTTAEDVAKVLAGIKDDSVELDAFAKVVAKHLTGTPTSGEGNEEDYVISGLADGYYFVKDTTTSLPEGETVSKYILQVVSDVTVASKDGAISTEKKVQDTNDTDGTTTGWQDSADYDIGDTVPYQITVTLPANVKDFDKYELVVFDKMEQGLTFNDDITVKVDETTVNGYSVVKDEGGYTFKVVFVDVKALTGDDESGKTITINYSATLNETAKIGSAGNKNTSHIQYSNNPNAEGSGDVNDKGRTPDDTVIVFTYQLNVDKVTKGENDQMVSLNGAEFTLEKLVGKEWVEVKVINGTDSSHFSFVGLDDGTYRLSETKTPAGYNTISPIEFTITAAHDIESVDPKLTELTAGNLTTGTIDLSSGIIPTQVENKVGTTLPGTGGMGTTLFYVTGSILVLGAVIYLTTKKRMENE